MREPLEQTDNATNTTSLARTMEPGAAFSPSYHYDTDSEREDGGGYSRLHEYWQSLRKHLWLTLGIVALLTIMAAIYMARQPDIFEAHARVQVDLETSNPALGALKSNALVLNTGMQDPTYFNTQIQILSSAGLLRRVVKTLDLEHNQVFLHPQSVQQHSTWQNLQRMFGLGKQVREEKQVQSTGVVEPVAQAKREEVTNAAGDSMAEVNRLDPYVAMLQAGLTVKQLNDTRLIDIRFQHTDPELSAKIVNAVGEIFSLSNLEQKTETNNTTGDFLQRRIAELQSNIRQGEEQLINYAKNHQILSLDASQNTVVDRLAGLNKQLMEAENDRKTAEAAYRTALTPGAAEALAVDTSRSQSSSDVEAKLTDLRQKRAQLLVEYTVKYPEVKEIDQQIAVLEKQAKEARSSAKEVIVTNLATRYQQALAREQSLRAAFDQQRGETVTQNEAAVQYRIIQQEVETNKSLLDGLLQRSKENDVIMAGTPNNIHLLDYAPLPKGPVGPRRMQGVGIVFLFSLIFGVALARYLDYLDDSVRSTEDVERMLRLPTLAVIPALSSLTRRRFLPNIAALQKRNGNGHNAELLLEKDARSPLAEAYRQLRTSVLLSSAGGAPQVLLVTSSQPGEGKTTTSINMAQILVQTEAKVLVIDADLRRPRLHTIFEKKNQQGLSTILSSKMNEDEMLALIQPHGEDGLHILTSGPIPPNPAELLGASQMNRLLATLKPHFTYIIFDSPPIGSFTDGVLLSSVVDGVLLVVHGGEASRAIARRARQILLEVGAKIFGVVLNNVNLQHQDDYYKYYYRNSYHDYEVSDVSPA